MPKTDNPLYNLSSYHTEERAKRSASAIHLVTARKEEMATLSAEDCGKEYLEGVPAGLKGILSHEQCSWDVFKKRGEMIHETATLVWSLTLRGIIPNFILAAGIQEEFWNMLSA